MCVCIRHIKKPVQIDNTLGEYVQQKKVGWEVIFSELWFAGSGHVSPGGSLSVHVVLRLNACCSEAEWASIL